MAVSTFPPSKLWP